MEITNPIKVDDTENSLILQSGDIDGFHICEIEGKGKIYVYYSEIKDLIKCLKKVKGKSLIEENKLIKINNIGKAGYELAQIIWRCETLEELGHLGRTMDSILPRKYEQLITLEEINNNKLKEVKKNETKQKESNKNIISKIN